MVPAESYLAPGEGVERPSIRQPDHLALPGRGHGDWGGATGFLHVGEPNRKWLTRTASINNGWLLLKVVILLTAVPRPVGIQPTGTQNVLSDLKCELVARSPAARPRDAARAVTAVANARRLGHSPPSFLKSLKSRRLAPA